MSTSLEPSRVIVMNKAREQGQMTKAWNWEIIFTFVGSFGQVADPVNSESLSKWVGHIPEGVVAEMDEIAPMLKIMGYDPNENPPNYEEMTYFT